VNDDENAVYTELHLLLLVQFPGVVKLSVRNSDTQFKFSWGVTYLFNCAQGV